MGRRSKTDYTQLRELSVVLETWCDGNMIEWTKCSMYQWNVKVPEVNVLIAVYPGSGVMWVPYAHYDHRGVIDKSSTKHTFHDKKTLINKLQEIIFAADKV
jgi:hypothetical protein